MECFLFGCHECKGDRERNRKINTRNGNQYIVHKTWKLIIFYCFSFYFFPILFDLFDQMQKKMLGPLFKTSLRPSTLVLSQFSLQVCLYFPWPLSGIFFPCVFIYFLFWLQRSLHSRNKKAAEFLAKGFSAIKEVDRVIDHAERNSRLLIPLLRVW